MFSILQNREFNHITPLALAAAIAIAGAALLVAPSSPEAAGVAANAPGQALPAPRSGGRATPLDRPANQLCQWFRGYGEGKDVREARYMANQHLRRQAHRFGRFTVRMGTRYHCRHIKDIGATAMACETRKQICPL